MKTIDDENENKLVDINYQKSLVKQRLIYERRGPFKRQFLVRNGTILLVIIGATYAAINEITENGSYVPIVLTLLIEAFLIISFIIHNSFVKITGRDLLMNQEIAFVTLRHFYPDLTITECAKNAFRGIKLSAGFDSGVSVVVLFEDDKVYFNKATIGRANEINEFAGIFNYLKAQEISAYFDELQKKSTSS